jgi:cytochrome c
MIRSNRRVVVRSVIPCLGRAAFAMTAAHRTRPIGSYVRVTNLANGRSVRVRNRVFLISALSGMACMLSSPSALPQASQGMEGDLGRLAFNNACRTCHMVRAGDIRLGPNLYKIVGRKAGTLPGYAFSSAMREAGFVWDEEKLDRFIANPDHVVPGNSMKPYGGLSSSDDRKKT